MPDEEYHELISSLEEELNYPSNVIRYLQTKPATCEILKGTARQLKMFRMHRHVKCTAYERSLLYKYCANRVNQSCLLMQGDCEFRQEIENPEEKG